MITFIDINDDSDELSISNNDEEIKSINENNEYKVMGGYFVYLMLDIKSDINYSKIMLSTEAFISWENLHFGITSDAMTSKKDDQEFLQPFN